MLSQRLVGVYGLIVGWQVEEEGQESEILSVALYLVDSST